MRSIVTHGGVTPAPSPESPAPSVLRLALVGANPQAKVIGLEQLPGKSNYFIGSDPKKWRTNVPTYAKVKYKDVYPGVDLVYYGNQGGQLEYDFVVAPGADPRSVQLAVSSDAQEGSRQKAVSSRQRAVGSVAQAPNTSLEHQSATDNRESSFTAPLRIDPSGDLVIATDMGDVRFRKPTVYQEVEPALRNPESGARHLSLVTHHLLFGRFVLTASNRVGFEIPVYDKTKPLVIDPTLAYSTYLGGSGGDAGNGIAVDAAGYAYVTGSTASADFPVTPGAFQATPLNEAETHPFVSKLNGDGSAVIYSTYLGGSGGDQSNGIAVDASGNVYVTGYTYSSDFPTTPDAFQTTYAGVLIFGIGIPPNGFVSKLNTDGSALLYSTYLGGSGSGGGGDSGKDIAVDAAGDAYVTGFTHSSDFPTTPGAFKTTYAGASNSCASNAFVSKLNASGSALLYSTYLGGSGSCVDGEIGDGGSGIAVDDSGNAYVTGYTNSSDFPTTPDAFQTTSPLFGVDLGTSAFVSKLNAAGSALVYSTYLGGSGYHVGTSGSGIAVDASGNAYVTGTTTASVPTNPGAFQTTCTPYPISGCNATGFVSKLNAAGSVLIYSTYLGGSAGNWGNGIAVDGSGNAYVTGYTNSSDFPTTPGAFQTTYAANIPETANAFVSRLNAAGSALLYSTYLGGNGGGDYGNDIAIDAIGDAYVTGSTTSSNFPTTPGAFQTTYAASVWGHAFVSKFSFAIPFSKFDAKVEIDRDRDAFDLDADFTLGSGGSIDLSAQAVTLVIGTDSITIPAGSFVKLGPFDLFRGEINGVYVKVLIKRDRRPDEYSLQAAGRHANLTGTTNPVTVTLTIGDNTGTTQVRIERGRWNRD